MRLRALQWPVRSLAVRRLHHERKSTPVGFEPTRGDPIGLAGRRLNRSAKVSLVFRSVGPAHSSSVAS